MKNFTILICFIFFALSLSAQKECTYDFGFNEKTKRTDSSDINCFCKKKFYYIESDNDNFRITLTKVNLKQFEHVNNIIAHISYKYPFFFDSKVSLMINDFTPKLNYPVNIKCKNLKELIYSTYYKVGKEKFEHGIDKDYFSNWTKFIDNHHTITNIHVEPYLSKDVVKYIIRSSLNLEHFRAIIPENINANITEEKDSTIFELIAAHQANLKYLYLYEVGNIVALPPSFVNMQELAYFELHGIYDSLSFSYLKQLPKLKAITLTLDLEKDYISTLKYIASLENLEAIYLEFISPNISAEIQLPKEFLKLQQLKYLSITGLDICNKMNLNSIQILQKLPNLIVLNVSCSKADLLDDEVARQIGQVIKNVKIYEVKPKLSISIRREIEEETQEIKRNLIVKYRENNNCYIEILGVKNKTKVGRVMRH